MSMPTAVPVILAVSGVASAAATIASVKQQKKSAQAQQAQQELQTRRSQRQALREAQIRRQQAQASALGMGVVGGSGVAGGSASLSSQFGATAGYSSQMSGLSKEISVANYKADLYGGVANVAGAAFTQMGGLPKLLGA